MRFRIIAEAQRGPKQMETQKRIKTIILNIPLKLRNTS